MGFFNSLKRYIEASVENDVTELSDVVEIGLDSLGKRMDKWSEELEKRTEELKKNIPERGK